MSGDVCDARSKPLMSSETSRATLRRHDKADAVYRLVRRVGVRVRWAADGKLGLREIRGLVSARCSSQAGGLAQ
jgi:hypothetical protein